MTFTAVSVYIITSTTFCQQCCIANKNIGWRSTRFMFEFAWGFEFFLPGTFFLLGW